MQKFIIQAPEDNSPEVQTALENAVYLLKEAGALVRTVNTMNEPIEPAKDFYPDYLKFIPTEQEQEIINGLEARAEEVKFEIIGTRPKDR